MFNPGMFGVSQQQMEQAKEVGKHIKMEVTKYQRSGKVEVQFLLANPNEDYDLSSAVNHFTDNLTWGFANVFDIKGTIREME